MLFVKIAKILLVTKCTHELTIRKFLLIYWHYTSEKQSYQNIKMSFLTYDFNVNTPKQNMYICRLNYSTVLFYASYTVMSLTCYVSNSAFDRKSDT